MQNLVGEMFETLFRDSGPAKARGAMPDDVADCAMSFQSEVIDDICEDLASHVERDPAVLGEPLLVLTPNAPFVATLCHRVAHAIWQSHDSPEKRRIAMAVSHFGRVLSGAEIHPAARIGRRFVLDHGTNTVIGATTVIGDDCYILNAVILGARGISENPQGKRHPTLGNRVQVGAFSRILGAIRVDDDVFIHPHSVVLTDVAAKAGNAVPPFARRFCLDGSAA